MSDTENAGRGAGRTGLENLRAVSLVTLVCFAAILGGFLLVPETPRQHGESFEPVANNVETHGFPLPEDFGAHDGKARSSTLPPNETPPAPSPLVPGEKRIHEDEAAPSSPIPPSNLGPGGALWSALTSAITHLGPAPAPKAVEASFLAVPACTPRDAAELEQLVEASDCPVITLLPATMYVLKQYITVARPVTIIGRPLEAPTLAGHKTYRIFMVEPGGRLDLRYVQLYRGKGRVIIPELLTVVQGAILYVRRGGAAAMTGCHVTLEPSTGFTVGISQNPQMTIIYLGGGVYVEGGSFRATGCVYTLVRPGVAFRETWFVGREFLVVTGEVFITGCIFTSVQLFGNYVGLGGFVFNVAGTVVITGTVFNANSLFLQSSGMGYVAFNGGGLTILTGNINNLQVGFASFHGGGLGVWNGGGVLTMTGMISNFEGIMTLSAGLGFQAGCGAGVVVRTGILQSIHGSAAFGCGVGHSQFLGSGVVVFTNVALTRTTMLVVFYGLGGYLYIGAGSATITNTVGAVVTGIGASATAGGGTLLLAGWMVRTNNLLLGQSLIVAVMGQGSELMVASGGAVLVFNRVVTRRPALLYSTPGIYGIWIAGNGVFFRPGVDKVVVGTKAGQWKGFRNMTVPGMARFHHMSWLFLPRPENREKKYKKAPGEDPGLRGPQPRDAAYYIGVPFFGVRGRRRRGQAWALFKAEEPSYPPLESSESVSVGRREAEAGALPVAWKGLSSPSRIMPTTTRLVDAVGQLLLLNETAAGSASSYAGLIGAGSVMGLESPTESRPDAAIGAGGGKVGTGAQTSYFYIGDDEGGLASCQACDVVDEAFDGPGASQCQIRRTCTGGEGTENPESEAEEGWGGVRRGLLEQMWVTGPGQNPANTSLAVLDLRVCLSSFPPTLSPSAGTSDPRRVEEQKPKSTLDVTQMSAALNETIQSLRLSARHHFRLVALTPEPLLLRYQKAEYPERRRLHDRRRVLFPSAPGVVVGEGESEGEEGKEDGVFSFRFFGISDWENVTLSLAETLTAQTPRLTATLQRHLEEQASGDPPPQVRGVEILQAKRFFVPGTGAGVFPAPLSLSRPDPSPPSSPASSRGPSLPPSPKTSSSLASLLSSLRSDGGSRLRQGGPDPLSTMSGWVEDGIPSAMLYTSSPIAPFWNSSRTNATPQSPPVSSARNDQRGGGDAPAAEDAPGLAKALVHQVRVGDSYTLILHAFPPAQLLTIYLFPKRGQGVELGVLPSLPGEGKGGEGQDWTWKPSAALLGSEYEGKEFFIEVVSERQDAFAYSQAFTVRP
ncbi:hypothetical protein NSK_006466 [Nannochloropsis salina CCMP1776]|uniref:Uncharacterized protein n=1 Tax=Nannochloropsis salina CCMP1776 TaxID=1027361 RepID=A0A4D9CVM2_9STRA|nr:hypothetical protein NSK_006466 [Nannochloropsis salina CCMP1776]|eukprot:TFJ82137.1 hypothetical protein NSK_006466 [Nannochloropsis salina CCMP1776]